MESDLGCTLRIYFDNVMLNLHNVTLTSQKPCQHNNNCDCSKTKLINEVYVFSNKIVIFYLKMHKINLFCCLNFSGSQKNGLIGQSPHASELIFLTSVLANKMKFFRT